MKNIPHTNLAAVRHERARGDSCSLTPDRLTTNDTPTPALHPTIMNTTITAWLATHALTLSTYLLCWSTADAFVVTVNRRAFRREAGKQNFLAEEDRVTQTATLTFRRKSFTWLISVLFQDFCPPLSVTNYKHLAAEQINHSVSWVITQIHAKSFTAKWWSGKQLTLLLLSL